MVKNASSLADVSASWPDTGAALSSSSNRAVAVSPIAAATAAPAELPPPPSPLLVLSPRLRSAASRACVNWKESRVATPGWTPLA
eukprot:3020726-Pyramimonas_sp.AAC.2